MDWTRGASWYDEHADAFEMATLDLPPPPLLSEFISLLQPGARILDAGCGVGRDSRVLLDKGFYVSAFDGSAAMVGATLANTLGRAQPRILSFQDYADAPGSWDGIWALASLIHLPRKDVPGVIGRLLNSLTPHGIFCGAVKHGTGDGIDPQGRPTTYFDVEEISRMVFGAMPAGGTVDIHTTSARGSSGNAHRWINITARLGHLP